MNIIHWGPCSQWRNTVLCVKIKMETDLCWHQRRLPKGIDAWRGHVGWVGATMHMRTLGTGHSEGRTTHAEYRDDWVPWIWFLMLTTQGIPRNSASLQSDLELVGQPYPLWHSNTHPMCCSLAPCPCHIVTNLQPSLPYSPLTLLILSDSAHSSPPQED
jgi:hypothetical protein